MHMPGSTCVPSLNQPLMICVRVYQLWVDECAHVHPESLEALVAFRLIPLDKCPGVGVDEVPRGVIAKAVLSVIG